jgi:hypothetical protein
LGVQGQDDEIAMADLTDFIECIVGRCVVNKDPLNSGSGFAVLLDDAAPLLYVRAYVSARDDDRQVNSVLPVFQVFTYLAGVTGYLTRRQ